ncbi:hypothetical protein [Streptomyces sp. NPDC091215]|uniref:WDGH domain-containing protein n=1 Tax=Streptomyces sp. NPDC091215 TaxID=3155192 RepID=UPI0034156FDC
MTDRIPLDAMTSDQLDTLYDELATLRRDNEQLLEEQAACIKAEAERDGAYRERAHLVALLAALYPAHIGYTDPAAINWLVVTIETPTGQMSWHIAERDRDLFEHVRLVPSVHNVWDGHSTEEKYARLRALTASGPAAAAGPRCAVCLTPVTEHAGKMCARRGQPEADTKETRS